MTISNRKLRAAMGFALAFIFASTVTLSSFAASNLSETSTYGNAEARLGVSMLSEPTGRLVGTGHFTIDGDEAQSGVTVLSGSRIATGKDGDVMIDLGSLGHILLRPETTIRLTLFTKKVHVSLDRAGSITQLVAPGVTGQLTVEAGNARLGISRGEAEVKSTRIARMLQAGEVMALDQVAEVTTTGETLITAEGGDNSPNAESTTARGNFISAGLVGVIALAGTATAVTLGVMSGRNHKKNSIAPRPSQVLP